jgi:tetratricopeptide (TPR) repeat protein
MDPGLREEYLSLFSKSWNHSVTREPFARLHRQAVDANDRLLSQVLVARLAALDCRADSALSLIEELLQKYLHNPLVLLLKARILCLDKRDPGAALAVYSRLEGLPGRRSTLEKWIGSLVASGRAGAHVKLKQYLQAIDAYEEIISRLAKARKLELRLQASRAVLNKALCLLLQEENAAALAVLDELMGGIEKQRDSALHEYLARALIMKGLIRGSMEYHEDALGFFDQVIHRFGGLEQPEIKEVVLAALVNRGIALSKLKYLPASLKTFDEVVDRCGSEERVEIQEAAAMALVNKAAADGDRTEVRYWEKKTPPPHKEN